MKLNNWRDLQYRKLERDGFCHCCGRKIEKDTENVFYIPKHYGQDYYYIMCEDCAEFMIEVFSKKKSYKGEFVWNGKEQTDKKYKYIEVK